MLDLSIEVKAFSSLTPTVIPVSLLDIKTRFFLSQALLYQGL